MTRGAFFSGMPGVIELRTRHPLRCQPNGHDMPLLESNSMIVVRDLVTIRADSLLEQLTCNSQCLTVDPLLRSFLFARGQLASVFTGTFQTCRTGHTGALLL